jgi:hypothetical protein
MRSGRPACRTPGYGDRTSLTSLLEDRHAPVREFFERRLPNVRLMQDQWRAGGPCTVLPATPVSWGLVGAAFDYRMRYLFTVTPPERFVAASGAHFGRPWLLDCFSELVGGLTGFLDAHDPRGTTLGPGEAELARYCYALAMYESLFRADVRDSPLFGLGGVADCARQLQLAPSADVADLVELAEAAVRTFDGWFGREVVANPTFAGSVDVGGADADLIIDRCLIDIKTTKQPGLDRTMIYQLLGYVLLDYDDRFTIDEVGLYSSRVPMLLRWPLDQLVREMSEGRDTVLALRAGFREVVPGSR